jgi:hypothetical protein
MKWGKLAASTAVGLGMLAVGATSASAGEISFASFHALDNANVELATNGGGGVTLTATTGFANPNVNFGFINPVGFGLTGTTQTVEFVLTATSTANAQSFGPFDSQTFSGSFAYIYQGAPENINSVHISTGETLLSGTFTASFLDGVDGNGSAGLMSKLEASNVNYSSPFFTFVANSANNSFSLDINNLNPTLGITGNNLTPFVGTMSGDYSTDSGIISRCLPGVLCGVPEPITLSLFGAGLAGAAALRRRRKVVEKV